MAVYDSTWAGVSWNKPVCPQLEARGLFMQASHHLDGFREGQNRKLVGKSTRKDQAQRKRTSHPLYRDTQIIMLLFPYELLHVEQQSRRMTLQSNTDASKTPPFLEVLYLSLFSGATMRSF